MPPEPMPAIDRPDAWQLSAAEHEVLVWLVATVAGHRDADTTFQTGARLVRDWIANAEARLW